MPQEQFSAAREPKGEPDSWLAGITPKQEAKMLFDWMRRNNESFEKTRALIDVPPRIEAVLRAYARYDPLQAPRVTSILKFRRRVVKEFDALARSNHEDAVSGPFDTRDEACQTPRERCVPQ